MQSFPYYQIASDPGQAEVAEQLPLDGADHVDAGADLEHVVAARRKREGRYGKIVLSFLLFQDCQNLNVVFCARPTL